MSRHVSRRSTILGCAAAATIPRAGFGAETSLRDIAAASGLRFGSASDIAVTAAPAPYTDALARHCGVFTPNMGWHDPATRADTWLPNWEDPNIAFAEANGMMLTGGNLLWHGSLPASFARAAPGKPAQSLAATHIQQTVSHYNGRVFSWNVVNEAIDPTSGLDDGLRRSPLREKLGPDFIATAFRAARAADGKALLVLNDTQLEMDTPDHTRRRDALLRLLDRLAFAGTPVDAVGLQTHMRLDGAPFDPAIYRRFLRDISMRGLRILITDMDVFDVAVTGGVEQRDDAVAQRYRDVLSVALAEPAVVSLTTSGLSDRYTNPAQATNPAFCRADGLPARPLPLDEQFRAKPAFAAIATVLKARV